MFLRCRVQLTDANIRLLITTRVECDAQFQRPKCKKSKIWVGVAEKVEAVAGAKVTGMECDEKWRNLVSTYRRNKDRLKSSGHGAVSWAYYDVMDELLGSKASSVPPASQLLSTFTPTVDAMVTSAATTANNSVDNLEAQELPSQKKTKKRTTKAAALVELERENQDKRAKMWEEQKALEQQKIDAINNLAAAISRLAGSEQ